jgi:hypothetical protein
MRILHVRFVAEGSLELELGVGKDGSGMSSCTGGDTVLIIASAESWQRLRHSMSDISLSRYADEALRISRVRVDNVN